MLRYGLLALLLQVALTINVRSNYDYIVVGGGSSGATVASRLSEDAAVSVLLIEAGGHPPNSSEIPLLPFLLQNTSVDWKYLTEPQKEACFGFTDKRSYWPRGKVLGGSSILNYMLYVRGNRHDYDDWARNGAVGWSFADIFKYFTKSEGYTNERFVTPAGDHRAKGPLTVSSPDLVYKSPLADSFLKAGEELRYGTYLDYNDHNMMTRGFSRLQATVRDGRRCSTEKAFLQPAYQRENFDVLTDARVLKVRFDKSKRAEKVVYLHEGKTLAVRANKEIILSAGAIGSPQILMLSGIGPKSHLEEHKIPIVADLPVGQNLQDHVGVGGLHFIINTTTGFRLEDLNSETYELFEKGQGPLSVPGGVEGLAFINSKYNSFSNDWPDIQLAFVSTPFIPVGLEKNIEKRLSYMLDKNVFSIFPYVMRPKSRGFIQLRSKRPSDPPVIQPNYLSHKYDVDLLIDALKISRRIAESQAFKQFNPKLFPKTVPGCEEHLHWSDAYLECVARTLTYTIYHHMGTCKMGDVWDPTTVVNPELQVKGVKGLRVADASIMPLMVSANINAACIMVGEKAADLIKGQHS